jgi:hypothetical protein
MEKMLREWMERKLKGITGRKIQQNYFTRVYPKVPGLAAWSENCKWYSSLPLCTVVSLLCESV